MSPLYARMNARLAEPFIWGEQDCMMMLSDWVAEVTGKDPAANIRGTYDSVHSCQRATGFVTDPVGAVERCLETIGGLPRAETPEKGDVAVLQWQTRHVGAIWLGTCWGCKAPEGLTTLSPRAVSPLAIWSVGYEAA